MNVQKNALLFYSTFGKTELYTLREQQEITNQMASYIHKLHFIL